LIDHIGVHSININAISKIVNESDMLLQIDHLFHPLLLQKIAEQFNAEVDELALEVATGRWVLEYKSDFNLVDI